jgi:hypothetical protein
MNHGPGQAKRYQEAMVAALRTLDPLAFARVLLSSGRGSPAFAQDPRRLEEAMHRFILTFPDLADLHEASRKWLAEHPGPPMNPK